MKPSVRKRVESTILAVLAEYIQDWTGQHEALSKIMAVLDPGAIPGERAEMERVVAEIMQWDEVLNRGRIQGLSAILLGQHYRPDQLRKVYRLSPESPWGKDWRSEGGSKPPTERGLRDTVALLCRQHDTDQVVDLDDQG